MEGKLAFHSKSEPHKSCQTHLGHRPVTVNTQHSEPASKGTIVPMWVWFASLGGVAATWTFDLLTPPTIAGGAPYVLVVLVGLWSRSRVFVLMLATLCLLLTLLATVFSMTGHEAVEYAANRFITGGAIVFCALLVMRQIRLRERVFESSRRERDYLEVVDVMLLGLDAAADITLLNRKGAEMLKCDAGNVLGKNWIDTFIPEAEREAIREMYTRSMRDDVSMPMAFENGVVVGSGEVRTFRWHNLVLRSDTGAVNGVLCAGEDVTEAHRVEDDLEQIRGRLDTTEQLMAAVVENAVEGIITIDTFGVIQTANTATTEIFGYARDELIGQNVSMLMPSPDREQHDGYLARYRETGVAAIIGVGREVVAMRKNGERFPIHLSISDVRSGNTRMFTGVVRNLTEQKRMQRKMQEQEALAVIGQMAAVVAHEVKNPLAGIAGVIQVLRGRQPPDTPEHEVMGEVLARIDSLAETLQDLLLFARPRELRLIEVPLNDLLGETARLLAADPRSKDVSVEMPRSDCRLRVDVDYMREALLNIYLNASQAMDGKGVIRTELDDSNEFCRISISDSGPGIPDDVRSRVFEPFFTTKGRGTGLGLALVKRVVERHGGEVSIACPLDGGTIVTVRLPRNHSADN